MSENDLRKYELMLILVSDLTEENREKALTEIKKNLTANKGTVESELALGLKDLAYKIGKHEKGFYLVLHFWHEPRNIIEIEKELRLEKSVIRFLLLSVPDNAEIIVYSEEENMQGESEKKDESDEKREKETKKEFNVPARKTHVESHKNTEKIAEESVKEPAKVAPEIELAPEKEKESEKEEEKDEKKSKSSRVKKDEPVKQKRAQDELDEVEKKLNEIIEGSDINI